MRKVKCLLLLIALFLSFSFCIAYADYSGTEGNLTWTLNNDGVLTISGTGAIQDYKYSSPSWASYRKKVKSIVIRSGITQIGSYAFDSYQNVTGVTIPETVTRIGERAFENCSLTEVILPSQLTTIDYSAFSYNPLTSITIPASVTKIGINPFITCTELISINVEGANQNFLSVNGVLYNKSKTLLIAYPAGKTESSFSIPQGVNTIGEFAFESSKLENITIPNSITCLEDFAFSYCKCLSDIDIPGSVTAIKSWAFSGCSGLEIITLNEGIEEIEHGVISGCDSLESIFIPDSVTVLGTIYGPAIYSGANLKEIRVGSGNEVYKSVDGVLFTKDMKRLVRYPEGKAPISGNQSYKIPYGAVSIDSVAFASCHFDRLTLPATLERIEDGSVFSESSVDEMIIPVSLNYIGNGSFPGGYCGIGAIFYAGSKADWNAVVIEPDNEALYDAKMHYNYIPPFDIVIPAETTKIESETFAGIQNELTIYIPAHVTSIAEDAFEGVTSLIIYGTPGTEAETFANKNGYVFIER